MTIAIFAGSFDPITNGHIDIIRSSAEIFDKVIVAVSHNVNKKEFLPLEVRKKLIQESITDIQNAEAASFDGLTVEFAKKCGAKVLIRGLRTPSDFEYEAQMAQTNRALCSEITTVFLSANAGNNYISSSSVREILLNKGDVSKLVPPAVSKYLMKL